MSLPDSFIPLYGNDFFQAIEGLEDRVGLGYMRAIWNYWHVTHCTGLRDGDSEFLRKICRIDPEYWDAAQRIIFDNDKMFTLGEDGKWHQKRAWEEWQRAVENYEKACARTRAATMARKTNKRKD